MTSRRGRPGRLPACRRRLLPRSFPVRASSLGKRYRGITILLAVVVCLLTVLWYDAAVWYIAPGILWLWNVLDAVALSSGPGRSAVLPLLAVLAMAYGIGVRVTEIDLLALTQNMERAASILRPMLQPDFISHREEENAPGWKCRSPAARIPRPPDTSWTEVVCGSRPTAATPATR